MKWAMVIFAGVWTALCVAAEAATSPIDGGLVVCIGTDALESLADEWKKPGCVFHCLEASDEGVSELRNKIRAAGCYGKVSVAHFDGKQLPYVGNLVNMLVIGDEATQIPATEIERVLAPYGTAIGPAACLPTPVSLLENGFAQFSKPYPSEMDEWPQYLHGADNNCVARDTVVGPPRHIQWISGPGWTRAHIGAATVSSMVSSGGRLFTIEDRETAENPLATAGCIAYALRTVRCLGGFAICPIS